jgi:hypothetical protein
VLRDRVIGGLSVQLGDEIGPPRREAHRPSRLLRSPGAPCRQH